MQVSNEALSMEVLNILNGKSELMKKNDELQNQIDKLKSDKKNSNKMYIDSYLYTESEKQNLRDSQHRQSESEFASDFVGDLYSMILKTKLASTQDWL